MLHAVLGPVRLVDAVASVCVTVYAARLAKWLAWEQVLAAEQVGGGAEQHAAALLQEQKQEKQEQEQDAAEGEAKMGVALSEAEKLRRNLASVRESLINVPELGMDRSSIGTRRERHPFPGWVARLGGFQRALLVLLAVYAALLAVALAQREPNLFELVRVLPSQLGHPSIGLQLHRALGGGVDWRATGLSAEEWANASRVLRDPVLRVHYERFGKPEVMPQATISDVLASTAGQFIFYGAWFGLLLVLDATHARYNTAFQSGTIVLGVAFFLDVCVTLGLSDLRDNAWLARTPLVQWMTSFERQLFMRHFGVPPLIAASCLYSTYTFVDYEEHALEFILELLISTQKALQSTSAIIETCRARREVLGLLAGGTPAPVQLQEPHAADAIKEKLRSRLTQPPATAPQAPAPAPAETGKLDAQLQEIAAEAPAAPTAGRQQGAKSAKTGGGGKKKTN
jgi:hypothetical protein